MKKHLLFCLFLLGAAVSLDAQSQRFALFEHFTQASCGPCATQNPVFEAVRAQNESSTHHVAYHTSWPGVDPMNAINPSDVQTRVSYYGVTGVPSMQMLGGTWEGGPAAVTSDLINGFATSSPLRIKITDDVLADGMHDVSVTLVESGDVSGSNLRLHVAVIEANISYTSPPGSNGEREFPNVFREFLTASGGDAYTPAGQGSEQTVTFSYTENAAYVSDELYILAWVQDGDREVVNSGSSLDPNWQFVDQSASKFQSGNTAHVFNATYTSDVPGTEVRLMGNLDAPADWSVSYAVDGEEVAVPADIMIEGTTAEVTVTVTPGATASIAKASVMLEPISEEGLIRNVDYTVMANITDLIIDHGGVATDFIHDYEAGLAAAGSESFGTMSIVLLEEAWNNGLLSEVVNIYDNVSWTFPSITDGEVGVLSEFLDNGGNLFINGQDIGWDTWDPSTAANGTAVTQQFYTDYLKAEYLGDGNAANNRINWDDAIYGDINGSAIVDIYGGNIYPDELNPIEPATAMYTYNNGRAGAVRAADAGHKMVYVGIDLGMISDVEVRQQLIARTHDWFYGVVSTEDYDQLIKEALGQNYPNPAMTVTTIPFHDLDADATLVVTDVKGATIHTASVKKGQSSYSLDVSEFATGSYFYILKTNEGQSVPNKIQVVR